MAPSLVRRIGFDTFAGLTVACIALPLNLALAIASGVPASMGLVSGILAGVLAGLLGGARLQITGPEAALVPTVLVIAQQYGKTGVIVATIGAGLLQILIGVLRVGRFVCMVPSPVVRGFMAGIGVLILMSQVPVLFGGSEPNTTLTGIADPQREHLLGAIVGFSAIGLMLFAGRLGALLALVITTVLVVLFARDVGIPNVGVLPGGLFTPHMPAFRELDLWRLAPLTLSLGLLASLGSLLSAASLGEMVKDRGDKTNYDRDLVAQGVTNIVCGLFGGLPVMGAVVRSAASVQAGAQTRLASCVMSLVLLLAVTVGDSLVAQVPIPALAGILVVVGVRLLNLGAMKTMWQTDRVNVGIVVITAALIATTNFYVGIGVGIALSLIAFLSKIAKVEVNVRSARPDDFGTETRPPHAIHGVDVASVRGTVLFWSAAQLDRLIPERAPWPRYVVVDLTEVPMIDASGLYALSHAFDCLAVREGKIVIVGKPESGVAKALERAQLVARAEGRIVFASVSEALAYVVSPRTRAAWDTAETAQSVTHNVTLLNRA